MNPYAPSGSADDDPGNASRLRDASMAWFAWVTFIPFFSRMFYNDTDHIIQIGLNETLVETLIDVVPPVIVTALIFVLARCVYRLACDYSSTRQSLMLSGLLASGYLIFLDCCYWHNVGIKIGVHEYIWRIGAIVGIVITFGLVVIDRLLGESTLRSELP